MSCPCCGRVYCDCSSGDRGQTFDEMLEQDRSEFEERKKAEEDKKKTKK